MKRSFFLALVMLSLAPFCSAQAQTRNNADREAVRQAALDYVEGIYNVEPSRIERSVHPKLAKLGFYRPPADDAYRPGATMTFERLVEVAKNYNKEGKLAEGRAERDYDFRRARSDCVREAGGRMGH